MSLVGRNIARAVTNAGIVGKQWRRNAAMMLNIDQKVLSLADEKCRKIAKKVHGIEVLPDGTVLVDVNRALDPSNRLHRILKDRKLTLRGNIASVVLQGQAQGQVLGKELFVRDVSVGGSSDVVSVGRVTSRGTGERAGSIGTVELYVDWFRHGTMRGNDFVPAGRARIARDDTLVPLDADGPLKTFDVFKPFGSKESDEWYYTACLRPDPRPSPPPDNEPPPSDEPTTRTSSSPPAPKRHEGVRLTTDTGKARLLGARADGSATQVEMSGCRSDGGEEDESCLRVRNFTSSSYGIDTTVRSLQAFRELEVVALLARHVEGGLEGMDQPTRAQVQNASQRIAARISAFNAERTLARTRACVPAAS